jgi:WD40 repeat protein
MDKRRRRWLLGGTLLAANVMAIIYYCAVATVVAVDLGRGIRSIGLSGDGTRAVASLNGGSVIFFSVSAEAIHETGRSETYSEPFHHALAVSPAAPVAVIGVADPDPVDGANLYIFDLRDGTLQKRLHSHDGSVTAVAFSDDGSLLLTAGTDGTDDFGRQGEIFFWDAGSWEKKTTIIEMASTAWCIDIDLDRRRVAGADQFGQIFLWEIEGGGAGPSPLLIHEMYRKGGFLDLEFSSDGSMLACAGGFGVDVIDVASFESVLRNPASAKCSTVRFRGKGNDCVVFTNQNGLNQLTLGTRHQTKLIRTYSNGPFTMALSTDGTEALLAGGRLLGICPVRTNCEGNERMVPPRFGR